MSLPQLVRSLEFVVRTKTTNYLPTANCKVKRGFTLIELLVVITIIGILLGAATVSYTISQKKGRDGKRKSDIAAIQQGLELYYQVNRRYPQTEWANSTAATPWIPGLTSTYIKSLPKDPINPVSSCGGNTRDGGPTCFMYSYYSGSWCSLNGREYILVARLEAYSGIDFAQQNYTNASGAFCNKWSEDPLVANANGLYVVKGP